MENVNALNKTKDNEPETFQTLAAPTARVLLKCQPKTEDDDPDRQNEKGNEEQADNRSRYVAQRVKEIGEFENRASGLSPSPRLKRRRW